MITLPGILIFYSLWTDASSSVLIKKHSDEFIPCEKDSYYFNGKCYSLRGQKKYERLNWNRASTVCKNSGGELASIHSQAEQDFLLYFLQMEAQATVWIGLNDRENEGQYEWTDGSDLNYTNWDKPSGLINAEKDCTGMHFEGEQENMGKWHDHRCEAEDAYICQMKPNNERQSPNPIYCSSEEGGGWKLQKSCYNLILEKKSWQDAEKHCKDHFNGHLVTVLDRRTDFFLDYVLRNTSEELWIGIKMRTQLQQKWTSGWHVSYEGFGNRQRSFIKGTCVLMKGKEQWTIVPCSESNSFICETSKVIPPVLKLPPKGSHCPEGPYDWRDLDGEYCYHIETLKSVSWYEANFECIRKGGNMVSLHSKEESDILLQFVMRSTQRIFIGLYRSLPDVDRFEWSDGTTLNYDNWMRGQPDNKHERCGEVLAENMLWNDIVCEEKRGYICSVKKIQPTTTVATETTSSTGQPNPTVSEETTNSTSQPNPTVSEEASNSSNQTYLKALIGVAVSFLLFIIILGFAVCYFRPRRTDHQKNSTLFLSTPSYPNDQSCRPTTITFTNVPLPPNHQRQRPIPEPLIIDDGHYEPMI